MSQTELTNTKTKPASAGKESTKYFPMAVAYILTYITFCEQEMHYWLLLDFGGSTKISTKEWLFNPAPNETSRGGGY